MALRASDVSRQLGDAGHAIEHTDKRDHWHPGYRSRQDGPDRVHVRYIGGLLRERQVLDLYQIALTNLGYTTATEDDPERPGHQLITITR